MHIVGGESLSRKGNIWLGRRLLGRRLLGRRLLGRRLLRRRLLERRLRGHLHVECGVTQRRGHAGESN